MPKKRTEKKQEKTVFAVIDLQNSESDQQNVAQYAANLAKHLHLKLVLYPNKGIGEFTSTYKKTFAIASKITDLDVRVSRKKINILNFFTSLHDIAAEENAAFIIMEPERKTARFLGNAIWSIAQKTLTPMILLPHGIEFKPYKKITIAVDEERKLQKMRVINEMARAFASTINIFKENVEDPDKDALILNSLKHIKENLGERRIRYDIILARKTTNFPKHLCKFSAKRSDLLVIEVEPGKIDSVVKQNIETLLSIDQNAQPVLLTKTKRVGKYKNFR